jgi:DNA-binding response OmpR family regulator
MSLFASPIVIAPRVLVAEDDAEMRRLVADGLRKDGYDVEEESDGGHVLLRLLSVPVPFDLIVSDIRMPGCTGLDILQALRSSGARTPVILMTAFGDEETRTHVESLGATLFAKPLALGELRHAARRLVVKPVS